MINNANRMFRFTSSNNWKLTTTGKGEFGFGAPALTYIGEKRAERSLGRSVDTGAYSQALTWGKICEYFAHKWELGMEYTLCSQDSIIHPKFNFWSGTPDVQTKNKVGEIKCFYPKAFYELSAALIQLKEGSLSLDEFKKEFKEVYWQVVSNAILLGKGVVEIISFTPTESQLIEIRRLIEETNILEELGIEIWQGRFIFEKPIYELPYIPNGIEFPNCVKFEFEIPINDVVFLTKCVCNAEKLLTNGI